MDIIKAKIQSEDGNWVALTFDNGSTSTVSIKDGIRRQHTDLIDEWLKSNTLEPMFTIEELVEAELQQATSLAKRTGELYSDTGITVPFTNDVANGLMQIKNGFDAAADLVAVGGMTQTDYDALSVNLEISATVKLPLTPATILPFSAWFWTKRSAFF